MKILKMTARFGKLSNARLSLGEGMNIITAPNESGKSTWCAFIRAMLYGIDTAHRGRQGTVSEKSAANPWSGLSPEGSLDLEHEGKFISLRRSTPSPNAPMRQFSACYTDTEDLYPLTGTDCGETLTGVDRDVFTRSAFVSQGSARIENSPSLEKRITAMLSTGAEFSSVSDADERLKAWQRERCYNAKIGMNARLNERLDNVQGTLRDMESLYRRRQSLQEDLAAMERLPIKSDLSALTEKVSQAEEQERLSRARLDESPFGARDSREVSLQLSREKRRCEELLEKSRERYSYKKLIAPAVLLIFTLALAISGHVDWNIAALPLGLFLVLSLISFGNGTMVMSRARDCAAKRRKLLRDRGIEDESGFDALEEQHRALSDEWIRARDEMLALRRTLDTRRHAREADPAANKRQELYSLEGKLSVMGDYESLLAEKERLKACIAENLRQSRSIDLAREMLQEASREYMGQFSPRLTELTSTLFRRVTGRRYEEISLDSALNLSARLAGDNLPHGSEALSEGTRQLLYLCLRLAISLLSLPEEKNVPIILDDALCTLDDERCESFLELLYELSKTRQIILFTCHSRERNYLAGRAGVHTLEVN